MYGIAKIGATKIKKRKVIKRRIVRFDETWCLNSSTCRRKNLELIYRPKSVGIAKKNCVWRFECGNSRGASLIKWISKKLRNCCFMLEFTPISLRSSSRFSSCIYYMHDKYRSKTKELPISNSPQIRQLPYPCIHGYVNVDRLINYRNVSSLSVDLWIYKIMSMFLVDSQVSWLCYSITETTPKLLF